MCTSVRGLLVVPPSRDPAPTGTQGVGNRRSKQARDGVVSILIVEQDLGTPHHHPQCCASGFARSALLGFGHGAADQDARLNFRREGVHLSIDDTLRGLQDPVFVSRSE